MHEVIHLQGLDRTPAKELARTALAFQYAYLHELMSKKPYQQTQNAWNEFNANEKTLRDIAKDILFVEELLATLIAHESIMYYQDHSDVYEVSDNLEGIS